jgi:hypothetical protein
MSGREQKATVVIGGALLVQALAALFWAGAAAARLEEAEDRLDVTSELAVRTARLEEQTRHVQATLVRIETKLDDVREGR